MEKKPFLKLEQPEAKKKVGLHDRPGISIKCADCGTPLMEFIVTHNNLDLQNAGLDPVTTVVEVDCGICGGKSYQTPVSGKFHPGVASDYLAMDILEDSRDGVDVVFKVIPV